MRNNSNSSCLVTLLALTWCLSFAAEAGESQTHHLSASPETIIWGYYDASSPPVLTVQSGDTVHFETLVTGARLMRALGMPENIISPQMEAIQNEVEEDGPHLLVGPIAVEDAEPGDVLEIRIQDMAPAADWAINAIMPGSGSLPEQFPELDVRQVCTRKQSFTSVTDDDVAVHHRCL